MLTVDKNRCTGCAACETICSTEAISMQQEKYGFVYPRIDSEVCINCGRCEQVCHINSRNERTEPIGYYALQLRNKDELLKVSSGGAFRAFAVLVLEQGGVVYGAAQCGINRVHHTRITDVSQLDALCRSKYMQSDISHCFETIGEDIKTRTVLFCGTACQTNAIATYLGKNAGNLILCDIVCHGVPAPYAFDSYCEEMERRCKVGLESIVFRDKSLGWNRNQYKIKLKSGKEIRERSNYNPFHGSYLQGLLYRKSCEMCQYAKLERSSDIVIADFWQYEGELQKNNLGVSLVVVYSERGSEIIEKSRKLANVEVTSSEKAIASCKHLTHAPNKNRNRDKFLEKTEKKGFFKAYYRYAYLRILFGRIRSIIREGKL